MSTAKIISLAAHQIQFKLSGIESIKNRLENTMHELTGEEEELLDQCITEAQEWSEAILGASRE